LTRNQKSATAGASQAFLRRVKREITPAQYVRALDQRVSERQKADRGPSKGPTKNFDKAVTE
jgi:hypothetical protein